MLEVNEGVLAPNLLPELFPSDQLAGPSGEQDEDFGGLGGRLISTPAFRSSPLVGFSSKTPKRNSEGSELSVTTEAPPDDYTGNRQFRHRPSRPPTAKKDNELGDH